MSFIREHVLKSVCKATCTNHKNDLCLPLQTVFSFSRSSDFIFLSNPWGEITAHHDFSRLSIASSAQGCLKHKPLPLVRLQIRSYVITVVQDGGTEVQQTNRRKVSEYAPWLFSVVIGAYILCLKKDPVSRVYSGTVYIYKIGLSKTDILNW